MSHAVTDIIVSRSQAQDGLQTMLAWSVVAHVVLVALLVVAPSSTEPPPSRTVMTISLGGAAGPRAGGMTQAGGREIQAPAPQEPVRRAETAPAPARPEMALPNPRARTQPQARPERAPREATGRTPTTGEQPRAGNESAETRNRGQGFGLSSGGGGAGGPVQLDVSNFCCPEYLEQMITLIHRNWQQGHGVVGTTRMKFTIMRDGSIQAVQVEQSSGFQILDTSASRALQLTARLPPLPAQFPNPSLTVHMFFEYQR